MFASTSRKVNSSIAYAPYLTWKVYLLPIVHTKEKNDKDFWDHKSAEIAENSCKG